MKLRPLHLLPLQFGVFLAMSQGFCEDKTDARITQLENEIRQIRGKTALGNYGAKTASATPQIDGFDVFITADFLWWKLYEGGTQYVLKNRIPFDLTQVKGPVKHVNFNWEPGYKVGLGCLLGHDGWDAYAQFTSFQTHAHQTASSDIDSLVPLAGYQGIEVAKAHAHWHVDLEDIDLVLGRNFFVSKYLALHPVFGITSAWVQQLRKFHYYNSASNLRLRGKNNFWGIGPRLALDSQYYLGRHFSLYGEIAAALLWGSFHVREKECNLSSNVEYYQFNSRDHRMVPTMGFSLGMSFETPFNSNHNYFRIRLGYEGQYWWRQNQLPIFDSASHKFNRYAEDLSLQGLTADFRFDF